MRVVQDDISRHQHRIDKQPGRHALLVVGLLLELGHALKPAHRRDAVEQPATFGVRGDVALDEDGALVRVEAGGEQHRGQRARLVAQLVRLLRRGERVEVDDAEEVLLLRLPVGPSP